MRVITTREGGADLSVAGTLRPLGARVTGCPAIRREPIARPPGAERVARGLPGYDWIVFTSAAAVAGFRRFCRVRGVRGGAISHVRLAAVGVVTARAVVRELGRRTSAVPRRFTGAALARAMRRVRGTRILVPRALVADEALEGILRRRGAAITVLPLYRTRPDRRGLARLRAAVLGSRADWVLFASASAVSFAMRTLGGSGRRAFRRGVMAASIGPVTSRELARWGVRPAVEADPSTMPGLARAVVRYHRKRHEAATR